MSKSKSIFFIPDKVCIENLLLNLYRDSPVPVLSPEWNTTGINLHTSMQPVFMTATSKQRVQKTFAVVHQRAINFGRDSSDQNADYDARSLQDNVLITNRTFAQHINLT